MLRWGSREDGRLTNEVRVLILEGVKQPLGRYQDLWQDEEVTAKYTAGREAAAEV